MKTIIMATGNAHKAVEVREILKGLDVEIKTMKDIGLELDIVEDGKTFEANALIKARAVYEATGLATIADDSGIEIDAFEGGPGVYSARWMGEDTTYDIKNAAILEKLQDLPPEKRGADYRCIVAAVLPDEDGEPQEYISAGTVYGQIAYAAAGEGGFGYDPVFYLPEYGKTMAELSAEEKNAISHRGRALEGMKPCIQKWLGEEL